MKRFTCFVCGKAGKPKESPSTYLTCGRCYLILEGMPPAAQKILSFVFRRLGALEREIHARSKARRSV